MKRQTVRGSITIDAPVDLVWEVVNDPAIYVEAIDWVYEALVEGDGALRKDGVYVERAKPGIREGTYRWVITDWDPPRRAVHSHAGGEMEADLEILLEPLSEHQTRFVQAMHYRALPAFRPLGFILERTAMKRKMQRDFDEMILPNFKRIAEARYEQGPVAGDPLIDDAGT